MGQEPVMRADASSTTRLNGDRNGPSSGAIPDAATTAHPSHTVAQASSQSTNHTPKSVDNIWRNRSYRWGLIMVMFHWLAALGIFGLFALGLWMTGLTYYSPWYKLAPEWHKSIGATLFALFAVRLAWRFWDGSPAPVPGHKSWERKAAQATHTLLYTVVFALMFCGYLISTADGRALSVFGVLDIPATITSIPKQEDVAGLIHYGLALFLMGLVAIHGGAALKHHYLDKDTTLKRMLGRH